MVNNRANAKHKKKNKQTKCSGKHKRLKWLMLKTDTNIQSFRPRQNPIASWDCKALKCNRFKMSLSSYNAG